MVTLMTVAAVVLLLLAYIIFGKKKSQAGQARRKRRSSKRGRAHGGTHSGRQHRHRHTTNVSESSDPTAIGIADMNIAPKVVGGEQHVEMPAASMQTAPVLAQTTPEPTAVDGVPTSTSNRRRIGSQSSRHRRRSCRGDAPGSIASPVDALAEKTAVPGADQSPSVEGAAPARQNRHSVSAHALPPTVDGEQLAQPPAVAGAPAEQQHRRRHSGRHSRLSGCKRSSAHRRRHSAPIAEQSRTKAPVRNETYRGAGQQVDQLAPARPVITA